jgi:hypothetical protein
MEEYYALLDVLPMATAEEIEEAYRNKKHEFAPENFEQGSPEWVQSFAMQKELDKAYNEAIMATFVPIQAFSAHSASAARTTTPTGGNVPQGKERSKEANVNTLPPPSFSPQGMSPIRSSYVGQTGRAPMSASLESLVEEVPVSFSDAQLLNMDIGELRETYMPQKTESTFFTFGIEDRLLRYYVKTYLAFTILDWIMRLSLGTVWTGGADIFNHYIRHLEAVLPEGATIADALTSTPPPSFIMVTLTSIISMAYLFFCSLPMPIVTRFLILGQPAEKGTMQWMLCFLAICAAFVLYKLTGFLFWLLPAVWAGSGVNLVFITPALCLPTLKYEGN